MSMLSVGSRGQSVRLVQQRLKDAGFDPGRADGIFGARTRDAVRQYQQARGLEVDGLVGPQTGRLLLARRASDGFDGPRPATGPAPAEPVASAQTGRVRSGQSRTATVERVSNAGRRNQLATGHVTINGRTYLFRSGGHGRGSLPKGDYVIRPHLWSRSDRSMNVGGVGYSFAMSDKYDPRVGATRRLLRIHPDGGSAGTEGCMGIVGNASVQRQFREDMRAELARNGGRFTLRVG